MFNTRINSVFRSVPTSIFKFSSTRIEKFNGSTTSTEETNTTYAFDYSSCGNIGYSIFVMNGNLFTNIGKIMEYNGIFYKNKSVYFAIGLAGTSGCGLGNYVYTFGGNKNDSTGQVTTIYRYDGDVTISSISTLASARTATSCSVTSGIAFIFGGIYSPGTITQYNTIQRWNGSSRTTDSATLANTISSSTATNIGTNNYIFGGFLNPSTYYNTIQKYDGTTRTTESATLSGNSYNNSSSSMNNYAYINGTMYSSITIQKYDGTTITTESATWPSAALNGSTASTLGWSGYV